MSSIFHNFPLATKALGIYLVPLPVAVNFSPACPLAPLYPRFIPFALPASQVSPSRFLGCGSISEQSGLVRFRRGVLSACMRVSENRGPGMIDISAVRPRRKYPPAIILRGARSLLSARIFMRQKQVLLIGEAYIRLRNDSRARHDNSCRYYGGWCTDTIVCRKPRLLARQNDVYRIREFRRAFPRAGDATFARRRHREGKRTFPEMRRGWLFGGGARRRNFIPKFQQNYFPDKSFSRCQWNRGQCTTGYYVSQRLREAALIPGDDGGSLWCLWEMQICAKC